MEKQELFAKIIRHLEQDETPSEYLNGLLDEPVFAQEPFRPLYLLSKTEQSPKYHPEGNAWVHTMMVVDQAAKVKARSTRPREFMIACFLHDIGKLQTTAVRKGRITSYGHDEAGEVLAKKLLCKFMKDEKAIAYIVSLVRYHMHILYVIKNLPFARTRQMKKEACIQDVALLGYCDRMGRTGANEAEERETIEKFYELVKE